MIRTNVEKLIDTLESIKLGDLDFDFDMSEDPLLDLPIRGCLACVIRIIDDSLKRDGEGIIKEFLGVDTNTAIRLYGYDVPLSVAKQVTVQEAIDTLNGLLDGCREIDWMKDKTLDEG